MSLHPKSYHPQEFDNLMLIGQGAQGSIYMAYNSQVGANIVLNN